MNKFLVRSFIKLGLQSYLILSLDEIDDSGILSSIASLFSYLEIKLILGIGLKFQVI